MLEGSVRPALGDPLLRSADTPRCVSGGASQTISLTSGRTAAVTVATVTDPPRITLLGREGCHLCDDARVVVERVASETGTAWQERSVDEDPGLREQYGELVPVVLVGGVRHAYWRVDADLLRAAVTGDRSHSRRWRMPWRRRTP